ncbi:glycoside hydrolase family 43 protein [Alkalihalobacillus sp. FSL R5-0424]
MNTFKNPIIPGFYPDPSICRVGEDYYLVTSTFEYFPGVPIFHSRDLVNWKQIGHVLDRPSQLELGGTEPSAGIWAPTIRYHEGTFYMITTFVVSRQGERRNFYVTANDPAGPWSDPVWLEGAPGIDPSLLFDDDGRVYYTGNRVPPTGQTHHKHEEIWLQELDINAGKLIGEPISIWDGALKNAHAQEAPHLYKKDGYYYLIIAEGGTGYTHAVTVARSKSVTGPYESSKRNPILTHRHLGRDSKIVNVGHADIIETQNGEWWLVCLASRPYGGHYRNLGRETFLAPMTWEDDWPVMCPDTGKIEFEMTKPNLPEHKWPSVPTFDSFESETLDLRWNFLRTPDESSYSLTDRPGYLRLNLRPESTVEYVTPSFIGRRQQHVHFSATTVLNFTPQSENETAGLLLIQNHDYQFRFEVALTEGEQVVQLIRRENGNEHVVASNVYKDKTIYLKVEADGQEYHFYYAEKPDQWNVLAESEDGRILSTDKAGGFTGAYLGPFATSAGRSSDNVADFDWFHYQGNE